MRVILTKDVANIGHAGDIVSVKKGYARNFLLVRKWAVPFTKGSARSMHHRQKWISAQQKKALILRQSLAEKLKNLKLSFVREASPEGKLFGSLTTLDLVKELKSQGYEVDKKVIKLEHPLKETGEYKVLLHFGKDMQTEILVHISPPDIKNKKRGE